MDRLPQRGHGLFAAYQSALRPDYFLPVGDSGVIFEVERGKTTINDVDLLDFWKCHICDHASYMFLMVPSELRQNPTMSPRREFATVSRRLATFFLLGNETNVRSAVRLGYGCGYRGGRGETKRDRKSRALFQASGTSPAGHSPRLRRAIA